MSQEVSVYDNIENPASAVEQLGASIAKSQIFGCQNVEQGQILAWECLARKLPPLSLAKRYDVISGKLSMKAQTMLADFRTGGGRTHLIEKSPERAAIVMIDNDGAEYEFELTWEQVKGEPFVYAGRESEIIDALNGTDEDRKKLKLKAKYATPRSRGNMLWNRLISDSVRSIAPEINCGQYTPDEIDDFTEPGEGKIERLEVPEEPEAIEASFEVKEDPKDVDPEDAMSGPVDRPVESATSDRIKAALVEAKELGMPELIPNVKSKLAESGLKLADLTQQEAEKLLAAIELKNLGQWLSEPLAGYSGNGEQTTESG